MIDELLKLHKEATDPLVRKYLRCAAQRMVAVACRTINPLAVNSEEESLGRTQGKIHAIKAYRDRTGQGLYESKSAIENHFEKKGLEFFYRP